MNQQVYVAGVGMTHFGKHLGTSIKQLTRNAVEQALADAGCDQRDVQMAFFANAAQGHMEGQDMVRGQIALRAMGFEGLPVVNVENACASASTAFQMAVALVGGGGADIVLAIGAEKMFSEDKARTFAVFDGAWDVHDVAGGRERLLRMGEGIEPPPGSVSPRPYSVFMDIYAAFGRMHMREYGTTQAQFAAVSAKNHQHSVNNPLAQYQQPYTIEEILAAPPITYPLTLPMCAPLSDGAAAVVLCTDEGLRRIGADRSRRVRVAASVLRSATARGIDEPQRAIGRLAAQQAYAEAAIAPDDIDVAEVHDASAMGEILQAENLGLAAPGEGGPAAERGEFSLGGRVPINPSGGLESKGHPLGATGIAQLYELVTQLRGEAGARQVQGARWAIQENGGGLQGIEEAALAVHILTR